MLHYKKRTQKGVVMSFDKSSDWLSYVDSEAFRKILREDVLEYEFVNGRKVVSATYALKMEAVDPKTVMNLTENKAEQNDLQKYLLNINVKRAILEEIALINGDVSYHSVNYLNVVTSFGFEKIEQNTQNASVNDIKQYFYHNSLNGSLLFIEIDDEKTVHKSTLYCQGKITDPELFKNIHCTRMDLKNEKNFISVDVKELLSSKLECLLKSVKFDRDWITLKPVHDDTKIINELKKSLNLLKNDTIMPVDYDNNLELCKKITHRTKRTLQ